MQMQCLRCFSKPHTVRFTNLETGLLSSSSRNEMGLCDAPDGDALEALEALDALQIKSGRLVSLPNRDLMNEEYRDVEILRILFLTGKLSATWSKSSSCITITDECREEIHQILKRFEGGNVSEITFWREEKFLLFGEEYPLGAMKPIVLSVKLANESAVWAFLDQGLCGELLLEFIPADDGEFTKEYVDWLPRAK
jgi:hypothetical protein